MRKFEREARAVEAALIRYVSRRQDKGGSPFDGRKAMPGDARAGGPRVLWSGSYAKSLQSEHRLTSFPFCSKSCTFNLWAKRRSIGCNPDDFFAGQLNE